MGSVLVIRGGAIGDFVLTLPAITALRATYPNAVLAALVAPCVAPLARCAGDVDEVWEATGSGAPLRRRLLDARTDLVVSISRDASTAWAAWRSGVRNRVGTARRAYSSLFNRHVDESRRDSARHELEYALSFAHRCGARPERAAFSLSLPQSAERAVEEFCLKHRIPSTFVVVHPGSGGSCPRWPESHFAGLIARLRADDVAVVVSVGPGECPPLLTPDAAPQVTFDGDLPTLASLVARASLVVGSSTGPVHLAAALGTPTLAFHAPWQSCSVARFGPYADNGWALVAENSEALTWSRSRRLRDAAALMATISPTAACEAVLSLLAR
jgi:ADP-heptose:LPS heptosyltransferase